MDLYSFGGSYKVIHVTQSCSLQANLFLGPWRLLADRSVDELTTVRRLWLRSGNLVQRKAKHTYSIRFLRSEGGRRFYKVTIAGNDELVFIGWIAATPAPRMGVRAEIRKWCERNFDRLKMGDTIAINLEEVRKH